MDTHEAVTAAVLAGGKSTRFGSDKATAVLAGRSLLEWVVRGVAPACAAVVVVRARGQELPDVDTVATVSVVDDQYDDRGPLAGLVAGFAAIDTPLAFAVSCDVPLVRTELVRGLADLAPGHDIVLPHVDGFPQPLLAMYRVARCLPVFRRAVEEGQLKVTRAFGGLRIRSVREQELRALDAHLESFRNVNQPGDVAEVERLLRAWGTGG